jgi:Fur family peroxide stress response transcriptional regulator
MTTFAEPRLTPQRRAVLDVLRASHDHPTASEVYDRVRAAAPGIGAATVYRTLGMLVSTGRALELNLGDGVAARYDANVSRHDHLVCERCGRAVDVDLGVPATLVDAVTRTTGFLVTGYDLQVRGVCPRCQTIPGSEPSDPGHTNEEM